MSTPVSPDPAQRPPDPQHRKREIMTDTSKALELAERIFHGLDWYEFDYQTWCIDASRELRRQQAEIAELKAELERIRALPVAQWEFRWTNPGDNPEATKEEMAWKPIETWTRLQTFEQRIEELLAHRYNGKPCYEVRPLVHLTPKD